MIGHRHAPTDRFTVLLVCTANKIRSPIAEFLLRQALKEHWPAAAEEWTIESAGVHARGGRPIDDTAKLILTERGLDASEFRNRTLTNRVAHDADLVLTLTREHRGRVVQLEPPVLNRTFTLAQFGYLLSGADPAAPADPVPAGYDLIRRAAMARSRLPGRTADDDIADPVGKSPATYRRSAAQIQQSIDQIIAALPVPTLG